MHARLSILLAFSLLALACSDSGFGDRWGIDEDPDESRAEIDLGPSCRVPMYPDPNEADRSDASLWSPAGLTLRDARLSETDLGPFEDSDEHIQTRVLGEVHAKAAIVEPQTYGDFLDDGLWYDLYTFDWARRVRANLHSSLTNGQFLHQLPSNSTSPGRFGVLFTL